MGQARQTDPYGSLSFAVGSDDDFVCFDYHVGARRVVLHAVVNSETGHFLEDFAKVEVRREDAFASAVALVDRALDWCAENGVRLSLKGWDQDPYYFARAVRADMAKDYAPVTRRMRGWRIRGCEEV